MKWVKVSEKKPIPRSKRLLVKTTEGYVGIGIYLANEELVKFGNHVFAPMRPIRDSFSSDIGWSNYIMIEYWMELPK